MKNEQAKRKTIEAIVSSHEIWKNVARYYARITGRTSEEIHKKFIDFLLREEYEIVDNMPKNVLCFVFNVEKMDFENRTKYSVHEDIG